MRREEGRGSSLFDVGSRIFARSGLVERLAQLYARAEEKAD